MKKLLTTTTMALILFALPALAASTTTDVTTPAAATTTAETAPPKPMVTPDAAAPAAATTTADTTPPKVKMAPADASTVVLWYSQRAGEMRASKLIGASVLNPAGETIGEVNEVLLDNSGKVNAIVVGVGGFLGMGEREVAITFSSLKMTRDDGGRSVITIDATKDILKAAPMWTWPKA